MGQEACYLKILLDSRSAAGQADAISVATEALGIKGATIFTDEVAYPIIEELITAEHALDKAHGLLLDAIGYDGPRP